METISHLSHVICLQEDNWVNTISTSNSQCPLCNYEKKDLRRFQHHLINVHLKHSVTYNDIKILPCFHTSCINPSTFRPSHYHCTCGRTLQRKERMIGHLQRQHEHLVTQKGVKSKTKVISKKKITKPRRSRSRKHIATCGICGCQMLNKNLGRHMLMSHGTKKPLPSIKVDPLHGIFLVAGTMYHNYPIHVKFVTARNQSDIFCENSDCQEASAANSRGADNTYVCEHIRAVYDAQPFQTTVNLDDIHLERLVEQHVLKDSSKDILKTLRLEALHLKCPLIVPWSPSDSSRYRYLSVYSKKQSFYSRLGRVVVRHDRETGRLDCKCCSFKVTCTHKRIVLWYLAQFHHSELITADMNADKIHNQNELEVSVNSYLDFIREKIIPPNLEKIHVSREMKEIKPHQTTCPRCNEELQEELVSNSGKILDVDFVVSDIRVYVKKCVKCCFVLRYQEHKDGLHNFDNHLILTINLCLFIRSCIKSHTAVGRIVEILESYNKKKYPDKVLEAYLHFEALTDHGYNFCCAICGFFPAILIMDANRKTAFRMNVSDIKVPSPGNENDEVNMHGFWTIVENNIISKGCLRASDVTPYTVEPNYTNWSPWICPTSIQGPNVFNSEVRTCPEFKEMTRDDNEDEKELTEEFLVEMLCESDLKKVKDVAKKCGLSTKGQKLEILGRLQGKLTDSSLFKKVFSTMWGSSGGIVTASCEHGVVYAIKPLIRGESVRDHVDILLSLKHVPSLVINDMPGMTAVHGNKRKKGLFHPNEGRFVPETESNIYLFEKGELNISLPWLEISKYQKMEEIDHNYNIHDRHPITRTSERYCAVDNWHSKNIKSRKDKLRSTTIVKELKGRINTQREEQLYSTSVKDIYFLNMMRPANHLFMLRLLYHLRNMDRNEKLVNNLQKRLPVPSSLSYLMDGRIKICHGKTIPVEYSSLDEYSSPVETFQEQGEANVYRGDQSSILDWTQCFIGDHAIKYDDSHVEINERDIVLSNLELKKNCYILYYAKCSRESIQYDQIWQIADGQRASSTKETVFSTTIDDILKTRSDKFTAVNECFSQPPASVVLSRIGKLELKWCDFITLDASIDDEKVNRIAKTLKISKWNPGWINDVVIDVFLLAESRKKDIDDILTIPCTLFAGLQAGEFSQFFRKTKFSKAKKILIPVNMRQNHWCLIVLDIGNLIIKWYDPLAVEELPYTILNLLDGFFALRNDAVPHDRLPFKSFRSSKMEYYPLQKDAKSCGVMVCMYSVAEIHGCPITEFDLTIGRLYIGSTILRYEEKEYAGRNNDAKKPYKLRQNPAKKRFSENWTTDFRTKRKKNVSNDGSFQEHASLRVEDIYTIELPTEMIGKYRELHYLTLGKEDTLPLEPEALSAELQEAQNDEHITASINYNKEIYGKLYPVFINERSMAFAYLMEQHNIFIPVDDSKNFYLMTENVINRLDCWRDSPASKGIRFVSALLASWLKEESLRPPRKNNLVKLSDDEIIKFEDWKKYSLNM